MSLATLWRRWAAASLAAACVLFGAGEAAAQSAAYSPSQDDSILMQFQAGQYRVGGDLRGYQTPDGVCVDLADVIQSLDLPVRLDKKSRRATGWLFAEDQKFVLDRDSRTVQTVNKTAPLAAGQLYDSPEGWCVDTRALAAWLGVTLKPDLRNSLLLLQSDKPLPFLEAILRQSRAARLSAVHEHDLGKLPQAPQPYSAWRLPSFDVVAQLGASRASTGETQLTRHYEVFASGEVAKASYDARLTSDAKGTPESLRVRAYRMDPDGKLLGPLKATQVVAGDVEILPGNLAGASSVGRGAFVSNRPIDRPTSFGTTVLRGVLPLGWDAELYRNGQLLAYQGAGKDGRYEFEVPLVFGANDLEVVLYGPQGQVRRERQSLPVGTSALAAGKLEYWAGIADRNHDLVSFAKPPPIGPPLDEGWHYAAGVQYGIDRRTVVGASGHSLVLAGLRRDYAELDLQRGIGPFLVGLSGSDMLGAGSAYRLDLLGKVGKLNVQAQSLYVLGNYVSSIVEANERSESRLQLDTIIKAGRVVVPLSGGFHQTISRSGQTVNEVLARGGVILPRVALTAYVLDRQSDGFHNQEDGAVVGFLADTHIRGLSLRGEVAYRMTGPMPGLDTLKFTLEKSLSDRSDMRLDVERAALSGITDFQLGYVRQFRRVSLRGSGQLDTRGSLGANLALSFSFGRDPVAHTWRMSSDKLAERGEAAVSVFLDEDGDGNRSANEKALPGVGITAGSYGIAQPTDKQGHAFVENLQPYEKVLVSVDESTLPDPFLVSRSTGVVVTPRPGVPAVIELAVAPTGEVEGQLEAPEGTPAAGVGLELLGSDGSVVSRARSEYDGYFVFEKVIYGTYRLAVLPESEKVLGLQGQLSRPVEVNAKNALDRLGTVRLRPAATLAAAP